MTIRFIDFVESHDDCFERLLQVGHVTASAWVLNPDASKTLLTHHRKLNKWLQLGGHADGDTNVLNVATREVMEESGISLAQAPVPALARPRRSSVEPAAPAVLA